MFNKVYLASASPRRRELLDQIGVFYEVYPADLDESEIIGESPEEYVRRLAIGKAAAGWDITQGQKKEPLPVIGSDTSVVFDGQTLGKPQDKAHAMEILKALSGQSHTVMSAVAIQFEGRVECQLSCTEVLFNTLSEELMARYWETGEPADKAGAYGIQGYGAAFVEKITGSYSTVVGLPLNETILLLERFGISYWNKK